MSKETLSTSEKEVPKIKLGLQDKYEEEKKELPPETEALNHMIITNPIIKRQLKRSTGAPVGTQRLKLQCTVECAPLCSISW